MALVQMFRSLSRRDSVAFQKSQRSRVGKIFWIHSFHRKSGFQALAFTAFGLGLWFESLPVDSADKEAKEAFDIAQEIREREERYKNLK